MVVVRHLGFFPSPVMAVVGEVTVTLSAAPTTEADLKNVTKCCVELPGQLSDRDNSQIPANKPD